jgi:hypothetical protein
MDLCQSRSLGVVEVLALRYICALACAKAVGDYRCVVGIKLSQLPLHHSCSNLYLTNISVAAVRISGFPFSRVPAFSMLYSQSTTHPVYQLQLQREGSSVGSRQMKWNLVFLRSILYKNGVSLDSSFYWVRRACAGASNRLFFHVLVLFFNTTYHCSHVPLWSYLG